MNNPTDIARLAHRFQVRLAHTSGQTLVASRVQAMDLSLQQATEIYHEIGTVDPTGYSSEPPQFRTTLQEFVHDATLDLLLAGKVVASDTAWNLGNYNSGNGPVTMYLLERDNDGVVQGEVQYTGGLIQDITWSWRMGQPIEARYTLLSRLGQHWVAGSAPHGTWGAQDTVSPGGIRVKDARIFLGGSTDPYRAYRLQGFTIRSTWRTTVVNEIGNRAIVGILAEPPDTNVDLDFAFADPQPDNLFYASGGSNTYYDFQNANQIAGSVVRVFDPAGTEGQTVIRAWKLENLVPTNASPAVVNVRGLSTKRYSMVVHKVTTAGTAGVLMYKGDVV